MSSAAFSANSANSWSSRLGVNALTKAEMLTALEADFENLLKAVDGLTDEQMRKQWYGDWSVREILGHFIGWHHEMDGVLQRISCGE